jgi:hypothetical protein
LETERIMQHSRKSSPDRHASRTSESSIFVGTVQAGGIARSAAAILAGSLALAVLSAPASALAQVTPGSIDGIGRIDPMDARDAFLAEHPGSGIYERDGFPGIVSRVYGAAFSQGTDPVDSAERFLAEHAAMLAVDRGQLLSVGPNGDGTHVLPMGYDRNADFYRFSLVGYTQHVNGIPVFRGDVRLLVRNEPGYPLVLASNGLKDVREFAATFKGAPVPPSKLDLRKATRLALNQFGPGAAVSEQEQVIWAGYEEIAADKPVLAVKFVVQGPGVFARDTMQKMLYVADAATGRILFQEDQIIHADVNVTVRGLKTQGIAADACAPEASEPLPYAKITYNGVNVYAGVDGTVTVPNAAGASISFNSTVQGRWFSMIDNAASTTESSLTLSSTGGSLDFVHNGVNGSTVQDESNRSQVNTYVEANRVRDYLLEYAPSFPTIPTQFDFPIKVMVTGTCNAFYDGASINFYPAGGGCNNTGFSAVVHHEYGHHIVNRAGSGQGAYGEGYSDCISVIVTDDSRLAVGFQTCSTGIRNADNTNQYSPTNCSTAGSAIHTCGTVLSGSVWSTRGYLLAQNPATYRDIISFLTVNSVLLHTGTGIDPSITIDFLTVDDNDANILNGTPNYAAINQGFSDHSMPGPALALLDIGYPQGRPSVASPSGTTSFPVAVTGIAATPQAGSGQFFYRLGGTGSFTQIPMTQVSTSQYLATIPAAPCGSQIQYYISAQTTAGATVRSPSDAPTSVYSTIAATGIAFPFVDTVETNLGWTLGIPADTATSGQWVRVDPVGTTSNGAAVQAEDDATSAPGTICFVTGQGVVGGGAGAADIDGGTTTLTSPAMDATGGEAFVSYSRWYSNARGAAPNADVFRVLISNNNGTSWVPLETVGPGGAEADGGWYAKEFRVADFVTPSNQVRLRFVAEDTGSGSLVEAAIDEVRMRVLVCEASTPGDINGDGAVDGSDLAALLSTWGQNGAADINGDGTIDGSDLAILLSNWG